jgi:hypothetical protein
MDIRTTMRYLGVPIIGKSVLFGDNQSVITSSTESQSPLNKRHNALSYHRVREAIAAGVVEFHKILGADNVADVLSKDWGFQQAWPILKPLLFWQGDTSKCEVKFSSTSRQANGECYGIHHRDMSVQQATDMNNDVNGYHDKDGDGTVGFVSALLYNMMYSRDAYESTMEEDPRKEYTNEG